MDFNLSRSIEVLERTPAILIAMLYNASPEWTLVNEGEATWSVYDIVGHLIEGEKTDWMPRVKIILSDNTDKTFKPFDRFAQFEESKGQSLQELLDEFKKLRKQNMELLFSANLSEKNYELKGVHPVFGEVSLSQLLATWTVHDLNHLAQICRVMAKQYKAAVGPWIEYLKILR